MLRHVRNNAYACSENGRFQWTRAYFAHTIVCVCVVMNLLTFNPIDICARWLRVATSIIN